MIKRLSIPRTILTLLATMASVGLSWPVGAATFAQGLSPSGTRSFGARTVGVPGSVPPGIRSSRRLARLASTQPISANLNLRVRDAAALENFLSSVSDPASPLYHHFLTTADFAQRFGPDAATRSRVISWLEAEGLTVGGTSDNGLQVSVTGTAACMTRAFATPLFRFQRGSRAFIANSEPIQVPSSLAPSIVAVSGLSTSVQQQPAPVAHVSPAARFSGYSPSDTHSIYNLNPLYNRGINGSGQVIAVASFADFSTGNVDTFDQQFGLPGANVTRVTVSAGGDSGAPLGASNGQDEAEMDIEMVHATAPGASILMYEAPNSDAGATALWNRIVSDNRARIVTTSWGGPEAMYPPSELDAVHQLLQEGAAQGQTFFAASGDSGAYDEIGVPHGDPNTLTVDYPGSDPYVTGVGGTTLQANGTQYAGETAWSDSSSTTGPAGSGGGLSQTYSRPSWQSGPGVNNQYSNGMRQVPDIAADADPATGYSVYTVTDRNSSWGVVGGTSAASPLWAGFAALASQGTGQALGFFNPMLYRLGQQASSFPRAPYHDVTAGDNLYYPATPGWDFATGWGSFDGDAFVADLKSLAGSGTVQPTAVPTASPSPRPTSTPPPILGSVPSISVDQVVLLHRVNGKLQKTRSLRVGETGSLVILYSSRNGGALKTTGTVQIKQHGKVVKTIVLTPGTYAGKPAMIATVRFTSSTRIGSLVASVTVRMGVVESGLGYSFSVVKP